MISDRLPDHTYAITIYDNYPKDDIEPYEANMAFNSLNKDEFIALLMIAIENDKYVVVKPLKEEIIEAKNE